MNKSLLAAIFVTAFLVSYLSYCVWDLSRPYYVPVRPAQSQVLGKKDCTTIQNGGLLDSAGNQIVTGYDEFGYNYQARMFNGRYCDYDRVIGGAYCDVNLIMKWNDAWLSNRSCDGNNLLDRHYDLPSYIGSGAWLTNHQSGEYEDNGETCYWNYFVKIVAKPDDAYDCANDNGEEIWGSFCKIQTVSNDPCAGEHGVDLKAIRPGLGNW
jgi:hypothetical protein